MNSIAIITYLLLSYYITIHVGLRFYNNGKYYILSILDNDENFTNFVNKLLLTGYYLCNLGYVAITIGYWEQVLTYTQLVPYIVNKLGNIILLLGVLHVINMTTILLYGYATKKHFFKP